MPQFPLITGSDNNLFDLNQTTKNKFLVLVFYRGIWCNSCKKQLKEINERLTDFANSGAQVVAVSADNPFKASLMKTFLKLKFPVLADFKLELINYFGIAEMEKGNLIARPAVFIFDKKGNKIFEYIGQNHEDRPELGVVLNQLSVNIN